MTAADTPTVPTPEQRAELRALLSGAARFRDDDDEQEHKLVPVADLRALAAAAPYLIALLDERVPLRTDLAALREAAEKASKGRWSGDLLDTRQQPRIENEARLIAVVGNAENDAEAWERWNADARFIIAAQPVTIKAFLDGYEAEKKARAQAETDLEAMAERLRDNIDIAETAETTLAAKEAEVVRLQEERVAYCAEVGLVNKEALEAEIAKGQAESRLARCQDALRDAEYAVQVVHGNDPPIRFVTALAMFGATLGEAPAPAGEPIDEARALAEWAIANGYDRFDWKMTNSEGDRVRVTVAPEATSPPELAGGDPYLAGIMAKLERAGEDAPWFSVHRHGDDLMVSGRGWPTKEAAARLTNVTFLGVINRDWLAASPTAPDPRLSLPVEPTLREGAADALRETVRELHEANHAMIRRLAQYGTMLRRAETYMLAVPGLDLERDSICHEINALIGDHVFVVADVAALQSAGGGATEVERG